MTNVNFKPIEDDDDDDQTKRRKLNETKRVHKTKTRSPAHNLGMGKFSRLTLFTPTNCKDRSIRYGVVVLMSMRNGGFGSLTNFHEFRLRLALIADQRSEIGVNAGINFKGGEILKWSLFLFEPTSIAY